MMSSRLTWSPLPILALTTLLHQSRCQNTDAVTSIIENQQPHSMISVAQPNTKEIKTKDNCALIKVCAVILHG